MRRRMRAGWSAAAVLSCALGMASKEVMVTAPVVVLLYDRVFLAGSWKEVARRRRGLYAGLAGTWLILAVLMARADDANRNLEGDLDRRVREPIPVGRIC